MIAFDLPAHGDSPATSLTPPGFAADLAASFDELGLSAPAVVGHSVGGWTALELAKLGRAEAVLALAPAGLWRAHSPRLTDLGLQVNWRLGQLLGLRAAQRTLRTRAGRTLALRTISARAGDVPYETAIAAAATAIASQHFAEHFRQTRTLRFCDGHSIPPRIPIHLIWAAKDHVALTRKSRFTNELPAHTTVETWPDCGHMIMWDQPDKTAYAAQTLAAEVR